MNATIPRVINNRACGTEDFFPPIGSFVYRTCTGRCGALRRTQLTAIGAVQVESCDCTTPQNLAKKPKKAA